MNEFGLILKKLRKTKGLNQEELANILGVRKTTISNYETGYSAPSSATLRQIADYLKEQGISYELQYRYDDCRTIKPLPFDFAIFDDA